MFCIQNLMLIFNDSTTLIEVTNLQYSHLTPTKNCLISNRLNQSVLCYDFWKYDPNSENVPKMLLKY